LRRGVPGKSVIVYPGGSKEIFTTDRESSVTTFVLADRKGFVKVRPLSGRGAFKEAAGHPPLVAQLALRHGASLVPVCVFNERKAFTRIDPPAWLRTFGLRSLRTPLLLIYGRGCAGGRPRRLAVEVFGAGQALAQPGGLAAPDVTVAAAAVVAA
jgi:hypothetical protein